MAKSGPLYPAGFRQQMQRLGWASKVCVFADFQIPRLSPDEPQIQAIEASHLGSSPFHRLRATPVQ